MKYYHIIGHLNSADLWIPIATTNNPILLLLHLAALEETDARFEEAKGRKPPFDSFGVAVTDYSEGDKLFRELADGSLEITDVDLHNMPTSTTLQ